jgi:hypothetical protein
VPIFLFPNIEGFLRVPGYDPTLAGRCRLVDVCLWGSLYVRGQLQSAFAETTPLSAVAARPPSREGAVRLPPFIAYGNAIAPAAVRPNSTLVFEVELLAIVK